MNILFDNGSQDDQLFSISPRQRRIALALSLALILFTLGVVFYAHLYLPEYAAFFPALGGWGILGDFLTAFILFNQFRASRIRPLLVLGCTYLFTGLISLFYLLTLTGLLPESGPFAPSPQTSIWFWCFWHLAFPCGILIFSWSLRHRTGPVSLERLRIDLTAGTLIVLLGAAGVFLIGTLAEPLLPPLIENGDYRKLITSGIGPLIWILNAAAFLSVLLPYKKRGAGVLQIWIIVAMLAFILGLTLSLTAGQRYTLGWYGSRVDSLIASVVVLLALITEVNKLFVRLTRQHEELEESKQALEEANKRLQQLSSADSLTRIANRRKFDEVLKQELEAPQRENDYLSLLMVDIDYFKAYNDHYGHLGGDMVLRSVASKLESEALAHFGFTARYGGEEFAVILPGHSMREAEQIAELLLESVRSLAIPHHYSDVSDQITISVGGFTMKPGDHFGANELIGKADAALYQAKAEGRARYVFAGSERPRSLSGRS
ncbi:sensor domain-containing diguanylate cyclase [Saccharibacillus alkalitolerans]|uniref:GGDEF domain-containing protein n=1 Tax=Saccharibacillus alkalitolerans TaxID=2705290 RepID=A0ABX0FAL0_9BACL|nr:sensor domain-containing diguanylate cyclase [Saccharibacillus alkalitolerans]NGZ77323.1 GGDEF domain-containing protein [Saccharibacillus alkalitolerans]